LVFIPYVEKMHSTNSLKSTYSVTWTVQSFCQTQINRCLAIISSDRNKQTPFPKHCSKYRYLAALGLYFPEHKAIIFPKSSSEKWERKTSPYSCTQN